jgi:cellobiose phosphorylase
MPQPVNDTARLRLASPAGLAIELTSHGAIRRIDCGETSINLFVGNELEGGPANLWLRRYGSMQSVPLLGPRSPTRLHPPSPGTLTGAGVWEGIRYTIALVLADGATAWFWHLTLQNESTAAVDVDLIYAQDIALAPYGTVRLNEYYVSQYVDHTPLDHAARGSVVASRQNLASGGRHPWCVVASLRHGQSFATDAMQVYGRAARAGDAPIGVAEGLPARRLQHEHSMAAIQDARLRLAPGARAACGFLGYYVADHPAATSVADLSLVDRALALPESRPPPVATTLADPVPSTLFSVAPLLQAVDLDLRDCDLLFGTARRHEEVDERGGLLSFFHDADRHVVLRAKELLVQRPHGHMLRTGRELVPDETALTSTVWMNGVFHSMLTQGHVSFNRLLSTTHSYLGLFRSHGQRVFVELEGIWHLLDVPSAFEMAPDSCRWIYRHARGAIEVRSEAHHDTHQLSLSVEVRDGAAVRLLVCHHVALNGDDGSSEGIANWCLRGAEVSIAPAASSDLAQRFPDGDFRITPAEGTVFERVGGDELLFADGRTRQQPYVCVITAPARSMALRVRGGFVVAPSLSLPRFAGEGTQVAEVAAGETQVAGVAADEIQVADAAIQRTHASDAGARMRTPGVAEHGTLTVGAVPSVASPPPRSGGGTGRGQQQSPPLAPPRMSLATASPLHTALIRLSDIGGWFVHNALIHYLAPRGLEQYSGGGWGTRDVSQGPVELLLAFARPEPVRDLLIRVFNAQNPDGDWPQWFMFFERDRAIRAGDSHGDVVFWPVLALAQYLIATADASVLDERVAFFDVDRAGAAEPATVWQHVQRALGVIERRVVRGTALAAYGHGDWNDALQPADPSMREHMCSAWTVTLHHQMLTTLARALRLIGREEHATRCEQQADAIRRDFQRLLLIDGVLVGYALFEDAEDVRYLLHPRDSKTGVRYSVLAMIHAILEDMLTPDQVRAHLRLIDTHLSGPDGVRLFDRPMPYHGGPQRFFQRAESATFFGREIGLMYMHAHLRYAQALAHVGEADRFFHALCQANPLGIRNIVPMATLRQAN